MTDINTRKVQARRPRQRRRLAPQERRDVAEKRKNGSVCPFHRRSKTKCHRKSILDPPCRPDKHDVSVKPPDPQAATPGDLTHGCGPRDVASANADHIIQLDSHQEHIGSRNSPIQQITDFGMSDIQFLDPRGSSSYEEHRLVHSNPTVCFQQTHTLDWFPPSILSSNLRRRGQFQELSPVTDPQYPQNSCFDQDHGSHPAETIDVNGFNYHDHNYF